MTTIGDRRIGFVVVDEVHRFELRAIELVPGGYIWTAEAPGPFRRQRQQELQVIYMTPTGETVASTRIELGWPAVKGGEKLTLRLPVGIGSMVGSGPW